MKGWCKECREECSVKVIDDGLGAGEYWGVKFMDVQLIALSDCCEAGVFKDEELTRIIDAEDVKRYNQERNAE